MQHGILLALLAYATYSWSDAAIKALGGTLSVFEIGFYQTLISGICIYFTKRRTERWRDFWRMKRPFAVQTRALIGVVNSVLSVIAFTTIPLAEAYAIIFLSPLFVTMLAVVFLREQVGAWRWAAVLAGFAGVLLVVRPGFRAIELGHLAAVVIAVGAAVVVVLMRSLANQEKQTTMLGFLLLYVLAFNAVGMALTGARLPSPEEGVILLFAGLFAAGGHLAILAALRRAPVNILASSHYSQIAWAVLLGATLFGEWPDMWTIAGLAIIGASGLLTLVRESIRLGTVRWNPFGRTRV